MILSTILAVAESEPVAPSNAGLGAVVLTIAIAVFLAWVGYVIFTGRRKRRRVEETPANLSPWLSDDELETNRVTRVLGAAVVASAVLAIALPVYYVNESGRQARAEEGFVERDVEEGEAWWVKFECTTCHGPLGGGGGAPFTEARSDLPVSWSVPSLNDVFYRYDEEEVRTWIVWGRQGTPMAPAGLEGGLSGDPDARVSAGGGMTVQETDQVITFLEHIQISQDEALSEVEGIVADGLQRVTNGENLARLALLEQEAERRNILAAEDTLREQERRLSADPALPDGVPLDKAAELILSSAGTCTDESAALAGATCDDESVDTDRDGISDDAERALTTIATIALETMTTNTVQTVTNDEGAAADEIVETSNQAFAVSFDPANAFTNSSVTGEPIADLEEVEAFTSTLGLRMLSTSLIAERFDVFLSNTDARIRFLNESIAAKRWIPLGVSVAEGVADYSNLAGRMGVGEQEAERAVGLFNGYCARCHTAGYAAGVATQQHEGSGAWAPALAEGRSVTQFPDAEDQVAFIIRGSDFGVNYGLNGLGSGKMPGFGQILSLEDIELLVAYERSL